MKNIFITGANGFIGRNLCLFLEQREDLRCLRFDISNTREELVAGLLAADFIVHLAGVNRPNEINEYDIGNRGFTEEIIEILLKNGKRTPILFSSSIQATMINPYGKSKYAAEELIRSYRETSGAPIYIFRLPNVFGKWCRPNYNSVIATWCYNTTRGIPIQINDSSTRLRLAYIDDVVEAFIAAIDNKITTDSDGYCIIPKVYDRTLEQITRALESFSNSRKSQILPSFDDEFTRDLYATWISYVSENDLSYILEMKHDQRGWLTEFIKSPFLGQVFISVTRPGISRGNHWHNTKVEKFLVIKGKGLIRFRKIGDEKVIDYMVNDEKLQVIDIPPGYTHSITNIGTEDLITIFWADEMFDSIKPDTFYHEVQM